MKNKIASSPDQFLSTDNMTDIYDLLQIISDEVGAASIHAKITDYIDPHFTLIDEQGNPLHVGDKILGGEGIIGTVGQDENGWFVTWENQLITTGDSTWSVNIKVQAKDAFMGNNEVTTNGNGSQIEIPDGDTTKIIEFDKPVVNVKELTLTGGENSEIIFYGEEEDYATIFENKRPAFTASGEVTIPPLTSDEFKQLLSDDATKIEKPIVLMTEKQVSFCIRLKPRAIVRRYYVRIYRIQSLMKNTRPIVSVRNGCIRLRR